MTKLNTARTLTAAIMTLALVISFIHIVTTFAHLGAGWDRWTAPFLIDTIAIVGKIYTGSDFSAPTRRAGRTAFYTAGILSLICNVAAGFLDGHYGSMIVGVIVVSAALWGESMLAKAAPKATRPAKPAAPAAPAKPAKDPKRVEAAKRGAATKAARKTAAAELTHPAVAQIDTILAEDTRAYI
jgi:hypothetical protein